jgi:hypothetical protein
MMSDKLAGWPQRLKANGEAFFKRHPLVKDAVIWAIPALIFGFILRAMLLSYSPYAYWGSDSRSYFAFSSGVLNDFYFSLNEKRRYLYPILLLPLSALPGAALKWIAWFQTGLGLATIVPFAYLIRKVFKHWRWFIVPLTLLYAGMPVMIWYEHELIAETVFFSGLVWACAGWAAWVMEPDRERARRLWWWFFVAFAVIILTKPSARFFWPGIFLGLVLTRSWLVLKWREAIAIAALFAVSLTVGDRSQSSWLLYTSAFPLTQMESPLHAEYKAEIRDMVEAARNDFSNYSSEDDEVFLFLRSPEKQETRPLWRKLAKNEDALSKVYKELALEAIRAEPLMFASISLQRLFRSMNPSDFKENRFEVDYFARRFQQQYEEKRNRPEMIALALGLPRDQPLPPPEVIHRMLCPNPASAAAPLMMTYVRGYLKNIQLIREDENGRIQAPTWLGWWMIVAMVISMFGRYWKTLGVLVLTMLIYLFGVFLVGVENTRYFAPVWPIVILLLAVPLDFLLRLGTDRRQPQQSAS